MLLIPARVRANSWEDVADLSASFGLILDPWQELVLQAAMGERTDGKWAAPQVALSAPRQNGKSQIIVARALAGALLFDERLIVISAHQADTARETFLKFMDLIDSSSALSSRISAVINALNREAIRLKNGATIKFKARTGAGGRGFSSDCLFLDEAQILGGRAWASINSTMSARVNPQSWLMGTPPTLEDDGEVFTRIRAKAIEGKATSLAYLEWSADEKDDPALEETRAKANPAWHTRINHEVVNGEFDTYSPQQFSLERLGRWSAANMAARVFDLKAWADLKTSSPPAKGAVAYGVKFSVDGARVALSVAIRDGDGPVHVETLAVRSMSEGTAWLTDFLVPRARKAVVTVVDGRSGAGDLVNSLRAAHVPARKILVPTVDDVATAHAGMLRAVQEKGITHLGQPGLDASVAVAGKRMFRGNSGGWGFESIVDGGDVVALESATFARHGVTTVKVRTSSGKAVIA